jgi:hypothetical protein
VTICAITAVFVVKEKISQAGAVCAIIFNCVPILCSRYLTRNMAMTVAVSCALLKTSWLLAIGMQWTPLPEGTRILVLCNHFPAVQAVGNLATNSQLSLKLQAFLHSLETAAAAVMFSHPAVGLGPWQVSVACMLHHAGPCTAARCGIDRHAQATAFVSACACHQCLRIAAYRHDACASPMTAAPAGMYLPPSARVR